MEEPKKGLILIDKPLHWTSFDVVKKLRNLAATRKIGHAGTLDPLASGLLILCFGKYTNRMRWLTSERNFCRVATDFRIPDLPF